ncbi:hypothetical protein CR513_00811, partial [Mucuna pruriens]
MEGLKGYRWDWASTEAVSSAPMNPSNCDICGATQTLSLAIHNIRHRAHNRRYCTNCVLKQHPGLFCPLCFELYDDSLLPHHRLMCVRCPSIAHRSCVFPSAITTTTVSSAPAPAFFCPTCLDADFTFFNLPDRKTGALDVQSAKVLVAAARIAAVSMSKAAAAARFDAERRAREAAVARKRAREALEHLAEILAAEQAERNEQNGVVSGGRRRSTKQVNNKTWTYVWTNLYGCTRGIGSEGGNRGGNGGSGGSCGSDGGSEDRAMGDGDGGVRLLARR